MKRFLAYIIFPAFVFGFICIDINIVKCQNISNEALENDAERWADSIISTWPNPDLFNQFVFVKVNSAENIKVDKNPFGYIFSDSSTYNSNTTGINPALFFNISNDNNNYYPSGLLLNSNIASESEAIDNYYGLLASKITNNGFHGIIDMANVRNHKFLKDRLKVNEKMLKSGIPIATTKISPGFDQSQYFLSVPLLNNSLYSFCQFSENRSDIDTDFLENDSLPLRLVISNIDENEIINSFNSSADIFISNIEEFTTIKNILIKALKDGKIIEETVKEKLRRVLIVKHLLLNKTIKNRYQGNEYGKFLIQEMFDEGNLLIKNRNNIVPLVQYRDKKILNLLIGQCITQDVVRQTWEYYANTEVLQLSSKPDYNQIQETIELLKGWDLVVIHLFAEKGDIAVKQQVYDLINMLPHPPEIIVVVYCPEEVLLKLNNTETIDALIYAHENRYEAVSASIRGIFGGIGFQSDTLENIISVKSEKTRIDYCSSYKSGIDPNAFLKIDTMVSDAIKSGTFPGCQVLAIWNNKVIFEKCYGYHTYDNNRQVQIEDLYDLASVTKILASTIALINLQQNNHIDINNNIGKYLSPTKNSNKANLKIKRILSHYAKLRPWIPFYIKTLNNGYPDSIHYSRIDTGMFQIPVADSLFLINTYKDTMMTRLYDSPLRRKRGYKYSDLGFIMFKEMIEEVMKVPFEEFLIDSIYGPLNLSNTCFNPLETHNLQDIVPTELDNYFRHELVHGYVHDMAAVMFGGVAGHAGLFSNARDVGVLMNMLINKGEYGNEQILDTEVIDLFNKRHYSRLRRGLGFDKPPTGKRKTGNVCSEASDSSFGHSGFTGTYTWADPENGLVFVFLSNRVYPDSKNRLIISSGIRQRIHLHLYHVINNTKSN